jgi:hypothetical protein
MPATLKRAKNNFSFVSLSLKESGAEDARDKKVRTECREKAAIPFV